MESMGSSRQLHIPGNVPEEFAQAVVTVLLLGMAGGDMWDTIYRYPPERALEWVESILKVNGTHGLVHSDVDWWRHQLHGH